MGVKIYRTVGSLHQRSSILARNARRAPRAGVPLRLLIDQALAPCSVGCRGFVGPVPPPLLMSASYRPMLSAVLAS